MRRLLILIHSVLRFLILKAVLSAIDCWPITHRCRGSVIRNNLLRWVGVKLGEPVFVDHGFKFICPHNIVIGDFVSLGHDNHIWAFTPVKIGRYTITAKDLLIIAGSHDVNSFYPSPDQDVEIGPGCWLGARVTVLGGVTIGRGCVVGAGSLVNKSLPDFAVAVGNPARVIRMREPTEEIWNHFGNYTVGALSCDDAT